MGNTLPCCSDNENTQASRADKKNVPPKIQKNKASKPTPTIV